MSQKHAYISKSIGAAVTSSSTTVGTMIDLAGYTEVGRRNLKLTIATVDCKLTTTTDQTITVAWYQGDTTVSSAGTAITGAANTSGSTVGEVSEYNVAVTSRYVWAQAYATGTAPAWGVVATAIPTSRAW